VELPEERYGSLTRRIGTAEHFRWLEQIVLWTLILNVLDGVATLYWITSGRAIEANPLMATLIATHPVLFVVVKCLLVALGSWLLWRYRKRPLAVVSIFFAFIAYYSVLIYHLSAVNLRLVSRFFG
jgi:hypothetical protein